MLSVGMAWGQTTLVGWNFPTTGADAIADGGIAANASKTISVAGVNAINYTQNGSTTKCAAAIGWDFSVGNEWWEVEFTTIGFYNITIQSKQSGFSNKTPRDFKIQYKIGAGGIWTDAGITCTAGKLIWNQLNETALPSACNNQPSIYIRWVINSTTNVNNNTGIDNTQYSGIDDIIIKGTSSPHCFSTGNTTYQTGITLVNFNTIYNATAKPSGYSDYSAISTDVTKGQNVNLTANINTDGNYLIYAIAWIDWNQNGDFNDAGEQYNLGSVTNKTDFQTSASPLTINIPATASTGNTRMRISAQYNSYSTPCQTAFDGEVEDYTINVLPTVLAPTFYSYQTGNWDVATTWTSDPSGTTQVGSTIPGNNDNVVILPNRTVTLPGNISTTGLNVTINDGGFIDLKTFEFTAGLNSLSGQGTLQIASAYFPAVAANSFVQPGGGTTEYTTGITLPSQATYCNLKINGSGATVIQPINLTLNGNLYVKAGTFQINDATSRRLQLTIAGNVTVDAGASITVGTGVTNTTTTPTGIVGGTAPFIDYYNNQSHRVEVNGDFTNHGTVRFTNLAYPVYSAFPPTSGATAGFATVYFRGASDNTLTCGGTTDFYNLVLDKGTDQTFKLTVYTSGSYKNFRLFGANTSDFDGVGTNPNIKKALWIRTGTLVLEGTTVIPSLTEGTIANSDYYIPANGALVVNGIDVVVQTTADDYREVNAAYGTSAANNAAMGISGGGAGSALGLYGKLQMNDGYLTTKESSGIIASGQLVINKGTVDAKQYISNVDAASFQQNGGLFLLRGRFQLTPAAFTSVSDLRNAPLNTVRANDASLTATAGTFSLNKANNIFAMAGGTMRIYDVCGFTAPTYAFQVNSSPENINVTGGTVEFAPTKGSGGSADATTHLVSTTASLSNVTINRGAGCTSTVQLNNALTVLNNLTISSGELSASNNDIAIGGNVTIAFGTTYTPGTNTTTLNGTGTQTFTVNLAAALSLNKFTIDKATGVAVNFAGSQKTVNVAGDFRLVLGTLNDNGNIINLAKNVYNSGLHAGAGKIVLNGTVAQTIDGNGVFTNLDLNNTTTANAAPVSLIANTTVNGILNLVSTKIFNIASYNLNIAATGSVAATAFSNTCYIQTSGQSGDGGITKAYTSNAAFTFPVGCFSTSRTATYAYTPASIGFSASPTTYGSITVIPVGYEHPATTVNNQSLKFYWKVKSTGFTGYAGQVTHTFVYNQTDATATEANYLPSLYNRTAYSWNNGTVANPPINTSTNTITDWTTTANSTNFIDADYTAGDASFGAPKKYYSVANADWKNATTWATTSGGTGGAGIPGANDIVVIDNNHTVFLSQNQNCASLQIASGSILDIKTFTNSVFSMVVNSTGGNGTFRVTTPSNGGSYSTFGFPAPSTSDFSDFNINKGTTEFYTISNNGNALYILPALSYFGNLKLSPLGNDNLALPNVSSLKIYGDLILNGTTGNSATGISWNTNNSFYSFSNYYSTLEKTVTINGDLNVNGGSLLFWDDVVPQHLVVNGNVNIASTNGACILVWDSSYGATPYNNGPILQNTLVIGGSLNNNGTTNGKFSGLTFLSGNGHYCDLTFKGSSNNVITGTGLNIFHNLTVNKGNSQSSSLTLNSTGALTTLDNNWLTLQNGTFIYDRAGKDFTITTTSPFTIPSTSGLNITNAKDVYLANAASDFNDVYLNGKLTLLNGNVYVGPTNGTTNNNNDIEYSGGGNSEIDIQGGTLKVNGQIRRNPAVTEGILKYRQSGGAVTINGNNANTTNAKLEVLNDGSIFNMSAGTLNFIRGGGGSAYGDLYLRPASSSVTGGTINFTNIAPNNAQNYLLDANVPLSNLTITGASSGNNATVKLMVNPLVLNGDLTLANAQSIFDANSTFNIDLTVKGNFSNSGTYNYYKNTTIFNGGAQSILGSSTTNFYNLTVNPVTSLTLSKPTTVYNDINLASGTLICGTNKVSIKNSVVNNATYTNTTTTSGFVLNGTNRQHISGTGTFGQMELNNAKGSTLDNGITLTKDLVLTTGIFDINQHLLTLGVASNFVANGTPFSATKMITSDGVWSNVGVSKVFPIINASTPFTFPLGTSTKYTPAVFTITKNNSVGSIRVNGINSQHPAVLDLNNVLQYYWEVESTGVTGFTGNLLLHYKAADVKGGPEDNYIAAQLLTPGTNWSKFGTDKVDEVNHTITFNFSGSSNITGECTAGNSIAIPDIVPQYTSNDNGVWSDKSIWTPSGGSTYPCPEGGPNGFVVTVNHVVTLDNNYCNAYKTYINNEVRAVAPNYGHNLGSVYGNGTLYMESAVFPAGRYTSFLDCSGSGTLEYGGSGTYYVTADLFNTAPKMKFTGTGTRVLPNKDLTICKELKIDGPTLDNSANNRKLTILGTMLRTAGSFNSGSGSGATVSFAGSSAQTIQDFSGTNMFNNLEVSNSEGLTLTSQIDVNGKLLLTNGLINTTATNILKITNYAPDCVTPTGGSSSSYVNGPLMKKIDQGVGSFIYPVGKLTYGLGDKFALRATDPGTQFWTVELFNPNPLNTFASPLTAVNEKEYWNVSGVTGSSSAFVEIGWNSASDLTPLMTENGMSDMRVAEHNGTDWVQIASAETDGSNIINGSVETSSRTALAAGNRNYTLACINVVKPRIRLTPTGPICGASAIPVTLTTAQPTVGPYMVNYTENGTPKSISPASFPTTIPTIAAGATYILTGFTYNYPAGSLHTGVFDPAPVVTNPLPTTATVGADISICGGSSVNLTGNAPAPFAGKWSIISGSGGSFIDPTMYNTKFNGTNGSGYTLRWTISSGTCTSSADLKVNFPLLPAQPAAFTVATTTVCQGVTGITYTVPNDPTASSYTWSYIGTGVTINGSGNSVTLDYNATSISGTLGVLITNACGNSPQRTLDITVKPTPSTVITAANTSHCAGQAADVFSVTDTAAWTYAWSIDDFGTVVPPTTNSSVTVNWNPNAGIAWPLASPTRVDTKVKVTVTQDGCSALLEQPVTIFRRPESGPVYHVPNTMF